MTLVAGADVANGKWVAVVLNDGHFSRAALASNLNDLHHDIGPIAVLALDIPIGLPGDGNDWPRAADRAAREMIGPRWHSVFFTPPRPVLDAGSFTEANALHRQLTGRGLTRQSWSLRDKIIEADTFARTHDLVIESHPEVCFRNLKGAPLAFSKKSWNGQAERRRILHHIGVKLPESLPGEAGSVPSDDILDAAVVAWTAHRVAIGRVSKLGTITPDGPGPAAGAIWY